MRNKNVKFISSFFATLMLFISCSQYDSEDTSSSQKSFDLYKSETSNMLLQIENQMEFVLALNDNATDNELRQYLLNNLSAKNPSNLLYKQMSLNIEDLPINVKNSNSLSTLSFDFQNLSYFTPLAKSYATQLTTALINEDRNALLSLYNQYQLDYNNDPSLEVFATTFATIDYFQTQLEFGMQKSGCEIDGLTVITAGAISGLSNGLAGGTGGLLFGPAGTAAGFLGGFIYGFGLGVIGSIGSQGIACELRGGN